MVPPARVKAFATMPGVAAEIVRLAGGGHRVPGAAEPAVAAL